MILNKTLAQLAAWLLIATLSNTVLATESVLNEHKNIRTGNATSDVDIVNHIDGDFRFAINT